MKTQRDTVWDEGMSTVKPTPALVPGFLGGFLDVENWISVQTVFRHTVDGQNPAPPKKPWNDDSPIPTNNDFPWFQGGAKWISTIHSRNWA